MSADLELELVVTADASSFHRAAYEAQRGMRRFRRALLGPRYLRADARAAATELARFRAQRAAHPCVPAEALAANRGAWADRRAGVEIAAITVATTAAWIATIWAVTR